MNTPQTAKMLVRTHYLSHVVCDRTLTAEGEDWRVERV